MTTNEEELLDVDEAVDHGAQWFPRVVGLKHRATENARFVVDQAIRVSGGSSYFAGNELGRLYRDVLAGHAHEGEHLLGQYVAVADRLGVDVPLTRLALMQLRVHDQNGSPSVHRPAIAVEG